MAETFENLDMIPDENVKISVIVPIYNTCKYLRASLDTILSQTFQEIEVICVDDGSTDTSLDMVKIYRDRDPRIRIITENNAGPALARNNGLRRARGEYVIFLDSDDFFEPTLLEELYFIAKRDDLDIAISKYDIYYSKKAAFRPSVENDQAYIYDGGVVTSKNERPDQILQSTTGAAWNKLFRRSFLEEKSLTFLPEVMMFEDVYFTVTALAFAERVAKVNKVLVHHRLYSEQSRAKKFNKYYIQVPEVYVKIKEFLMKGGMYHPLAKGFLNLSVSRCYNVFKLLDTDGKEQFWTALHDTYANSLGWSEFNADDILGAEELEFISGTVNYNYARYKAINKRKKRERAFYMRLIRFFTGAKRDKTDGES